MDESTKNELRIHIAELQRIKKMVNQLVDCKIREFLQSLEKNNDHE
jgi:hypothetical protein